MPELSKQIQQGERHLTSNNRKFRISTSLNNRESTLLDTDQLRPEKRWAVQELAKGWFPLVRAVIASFGFNPFCLEKRLCHKNVASA